ncbi:MAG: metallophosphoesterase [Saccharofermentanales bacterium]
MRIIILSDLHITSDSNYDSIPWVNNLCSFIKNGKYYADTLIVVLGDIIDNDGKNSEIAFEAADRIFSYIKAKFSTVNYKIAFVPGNHDYCNGNLNTFDRFCRRHQTASPETFVFSDRTTFNMPMGDINLIFTDSIQKKDYGIPGQLDLESIRSCILPDKENLLFMHHSLLFEDLSDHTGIIQQPAALNFLKQHGIKFVFHGHAHAMRNYEVNGNCRLFGVGSIGVEDPGIDNEKEQFLEVQVSGKCIEAVVNWLWRGGDGKYREYCIYPDSSRNYGSGEMIPYFPYEEPEDYIERYVLPYDIASQDEVTRYFALDKKTTLFDACMEEQLVLLIADAGLGKSVEMQHLAHVVTSEKSYLRPVYLSLNEYEGESIEDYLFIRVPKYKTLDPNRFVLILDGYDELPNPDAFKRALSRYIAANSKTLVCISMRSNFLAANASVFKDFSVYQLLELRRSDIELELKKHHIDKQAFYVECMQRGLSILLSNPFYLRKIIEIFLSDGLLPNQSGLIARFINIQF